MPGEASLDHAPEGLHRRYTPIHSLIHILEREGLTWGILLNAFTLRVVRRSEGFVASHLEFDLDAIGRDLAGAREAFHLLWGLLRQDSWMPAPALLDEVVKPAMAQAEKAFSAALSRINIEDLCRRAEPLGDVST